MLFEDVIDLKSAKIFGKTLKQKVPWNSGVTTRYGTTSRKQANLEICDEKLQKFVMDNIIQLFNCKYEDGNVGILDVYLNYYRDGSDFCPKHRHMGTKQMILSLGDERTLIVGNTHHLLKNGSVIFFGDEYHEIKRDNSGERISIVVFYLEIGNVKGWELLSHKEVK